MSVGGQKGSQNQSGSYSGQTSSSTIMDPTQAWKDASGNFQGATGQNGLTPDQQAAINQGRSWMDTTPFQTSAGIINNMLMPDASAPAHQAGAAGPVMSGDISALMKSFSDPYTQSVVDATTNDAAAALKNNLTDIDAMYGGQYGNGRAGVATGQAVGDATRSLATTIANLRDKGFNTALGGATAQAGNDLTASNANTGFEQQRNFFNTQQQNIADQNKQSILSQILNNVGATQDRNTQAEQNVYGMSGGGLQNILSFMNSQVPAFNQTTNSTASGSSQSGGGSSQKGGGLKLF